MQGLRQVTHAWRNHFKHYLWRSFLLQFAPSGLLRNRLDDESWFGEITGTALLATTVFRMGVLEPEVFTYNGGMISWAHDIFNVLDKYDCINEEGIVAPVANSTTDDQRTPLDGVSPEAQAFVVLLYAAWRDWHWWCIENGHVDRF